MNIARNSLPAYRHKYSPKKFTQHQLFACLVLKNFLKTDYRGLVHYLKDCPTLCTAIELKAVPHFTTFQKAGKRLLVSRNARKLLDETVRRQMGRRRYVRDAAIDSTGLSATSASPYFVKRRSRKGNPWKTVVYHRYPKLGVVSNVKNHFILAFKVGSGPCPDVAEFRELITKASNRVKLDRIVADAGYDSESNHEFTRDEMKFKSIIPAKHGRPTTKPAKGRYRRMMQTHFNKIRYRQRAQVETVMSMIKRRQGSHCNGRTFWSRCRELTLMVLAHNIMILRQAYVFYRACQEPFLGRFQLPRRIRCRHRHSKFRLPSVM